MCEKTIYDCVLPMSATYRTEDGKALCGLCNEPEETMRMYLDLDHGWVHWACIGRLRKLTRQEQNFEALMSGVDFFDETAPREPDPIEQHLAHEEWLRDAEGEEG